MSRLIVMEKSIGSDMKILCLVVQNGAWVCVGGTRGRMVISFDETRNKQEWILFRISFQAHVTRENEYEARIPLEENARLRDMWPRTGSESDRLSPSPDY